MRNLSGPHLNDKSYAISVTPPHSSHFTTIVCESQEDDHSFFSFVLIMPLGALCPWVLCALGCSVPRVLCAACGLKSEFLFSVYQNEPLTPTSHKQTKTEVIKPGIDIWDAPLTAAL
jgi:hypothetical protein